MGFDLTKAKASNKDDEGVVVEVEYRDGTPATYSDATGTERPVTIRIAGTYSKVFRRTSDAQTQRLIRSNTRKPSTEQIQANRNELVAACLMAWEGVEQDGKPFPLTRENALAFLADAPWMRDKLEAAQSDAAGFSASSSTS